MEELKVWRCYSCRRLFPLDVKGREVYVDRGGHVKPALVCEECYVRVTEPPARGNLTEGE